MKIVLATGIFPPDIGGPATYVSAMAQELRTRGDDVIVITYGNSQGFEKTEGYWLVRVGKSGGPLRRWLRYREALRMHGQDADYVCAFTSISAGIPLLMSGLRAPKKILRLGGEFFWERYTDAGGTMTLREWYASRFGFWRMLHSCIMGPVLKNFDQLIYSSDFQRQIHAKAYRSLPSSSTEHNAAPEPIYTKHVLRTPFRILFMGRFVRFKNIPLLIAAMQKLPDAHLTIIGGGPIESEIRMQVVREGTGDRITFCSPVSGAEKGQAFDDHDLLVLPSLTDISPNVALEANAVCLPVLLTEETGLQASPGLLLRPLRSAEQIAHEIRAIITEYPPVHTDEQIRTYSTISDAFFPPRQ